MTDPATPRPTAADADTPAPLTTDEERHLRKYIRQATGTGLRFHYEQPEITVARVLATLDAARAVPETALTAPVIDDYLPDATPEMRRGWEAAIRATLDAARAVPEPSGLREALYLAEQVGREGNAAAAYNILSEAVAAALSTERSDEGMG